MTVDVIVGIILCILFGLDIILNLVCLYSTAAWEKHVKEQEKKSNGGAMFAFSTVQNHEIDHSSELTTSEAETILKIARRLETSPETGDIIGFFVYPYGSTEVKLLKCDDLKQAFRS